MRYIDLNEELANEDAHVLASRLAAVLITTPWWERSNLNFTAIAAYVEDLTEKADTLKRDELYTLLRGANEVHDLDAYQAAYSRLYGFEDAYIEYEWSHEW